MSRGPSTPGKGAASVEAGAGAAGRTRGWGHETRGGSGPDGRCWLAIRQRGEAQPVWTAGCVFSGGLTRGRAGGCGPTTSVVSEKPNHAAARTGVQGGAGGGGDWRVVPGSHDE